MMLSPIKVGWEVSKVVDCLKASGHQVAIVLKLARSWDEGEEREECTDGGSESCDSHELLSADHTTLGPCSESSPQHSASVSPIPPADEYEQEARSPVFVLVRDASLDLKRTSSAPLSGQERVVPPPLERPNNRVKLRQRNTSEGSSIDDFPDGGTPKGG